MDLDLNRFFHMIPTLPMVWQALRERLAATVGTSAQYVQLDIRAALRRRTLAATAAIAVDVTINLPDAASASKAKAALA